MGQQHRCKLLEFWAANDSVKVPIFNKMDDHFHQIRTRMEKSITKNNKKKESNTYIHVNSLSSSTPNFLSSDVLFLLLFLYRGQVICIVQNRDFFKIPNSIRFIVI
jgi:hypothetical protein